MSELRPTTELIQAPSSEERIKSAFAPTDATQRAEERGDPVSATLFDPDEIPEAERVDTSKDTVIVEDTSEALDTDTSLSVEPDAAAYEPSKNEAVPSVGEAPASRESTASDTHVEEYAREPEEDSEPQAIEEETVSVNDLHKNVTEKAASTGSDASVVPPSELEKRPEPDTVTLPQEPRDARRPPWPNKAPLPVNEIDRKTAVALATKPSRVEELAWRAKEVGAGADIAPFAQEQGEAAKADLARMGKLNITSDVGTGLFRTAPNLEVPPPKPSLLLADPEGEVAYSHMDDASVAFVGAGLASTSLAAYLTHRGLSAEHMTLIDPTGDFGGQWQDPNVQLGGFNNPVDMAILPGHVLDTSNRSGEKMLAMQRELAAAQLEDCTLVPDSVADLQRDKKSGEWHVRTSQGAVVDADYVVVANGTPYPRKIDGPRIQSNLDEMPGRVAPEELLIEREQRALTKQDLSSGRELVFMGIGNSTGTMLRQLQYYEIKTGLTVPYTILTDRSQQALENPARSRDGKPPIYRDPQNGYLTGYSGDIREDNVGYRQALLEGRIVSGVRQVNYSRKSGGLQIVTTQGARKIIPAPHVFALLGNVRDYRLFDKIGNDVRTSSRVSPAIRPVDGAVRTKRDGYKSNVFALGSVAATSYDPNAAVGPGIASRLPHVALTMAVRTYAEQQAAQTPRRRIFARV
jgi:hypothetical protein